MPRKKYSADIKAKTVIEVLKERKTANEIAAQLAVHTLGAFIMSPTSLPLFVALVALVGCGNSGSKISKESHSTAPSSAPTTTAAPTSTSTGTPSSQPSASVAPTSSQTNQPPTPVCPPEAPGPAMAVVKAPSGASYCIDTTEVTQSQYKQFLDQASNFKPSWPEPCKDTLLVPPYEDPEGNPAYCGEFYHPEQRPNAPMTCVTWCQAHAYCEWAGKRLCGKIGGGSVEKEMNTNAEVSEWYNVCSSGGKHMYPYGDEYKPEACTDKTWLEKTAGMGASCNSAACLPDVKSSPLCHAKEGGGSLVLDMSGSVYEWENSLFFQKGFFAVARLGNFMEPGKDCKDFGYVYPTVPNGVLGFRCCADAK